MWGLLLLYAVSYTPHTQHEEFGTISLGAESEVDTAPPSLHKRSGTSGQNSFKYVPSSVGVRLQETGKDHLTLLLPWKLMLLELSVPLVQVLLAMQGVAENFTSQSLGRVRGGVYEE